MTKVFDGLLLLLRRLFFITPVERTHHQDVDQDTEKQQDEKENDQPGER